MAWEQIAVKHAGRTYPSQRNGDVFCIPCASGLGEGETFEAGGKLYAVVSAVDTAGRGENFEVKAEVKNDKPKARRTVADTSGQDVSVSADDGHDDPS